MSNLAARLRKTREQKKTVNGHTFRFKRPTAGDLITPLKPFDLVRDFVIDWDLTDSDYFPFAGSNEPIKFDREAWSEWIVDHDEYWEPLAEAIIESYRMYRDKKEESVKNSETGSQDKTQD